MDRERTAVVTEAIEKVACADGVSTPSVAHVCHACADVVGAVGVCAAAPGAAGPYEPLCAAGPVGAELAELQATVGEGPGTETVTRGRPMLVSNLDAAGVQRRWPLFASAASELGTTAVLAFPLQVGAIRVGVLEIYWAKRPARSSALSYGLLFADAALRALIEADDVDGTGEPYLDRWPEVHQATGMVSAQLRVGAAEAYALLRAYAFAGDQSLRAVAREVVERRLHFSPDKDP